MPGSTQCRSMRPWRGRRFLRESLSAFQDLSRRSHRIGRLAPAALGAAVLALAGASAAAARTAYVSNATKEAVTPINLATNTAETGISDTVATSSIAITPNGKLAYAPSSKHALLTPFNLETGLAETPVDIEVEGKTKVEPESLAITPNGKFVYVADEETKGKEGSVTVVEVATNTVVKVIPAGLEPEGVAITPNGQTAYVADKANEAEGAVEVIDNASNPASAAVVKTIDIGSKVEPEKIAITPNGQTAYVADGAAGTVTAIDTATNEIVGTIKVGGAEEDANEPDAIAITPNGQSAYVSDGKAGTVVPISLATDAVGTPITVGAAESEPHGIAITPNGKTLYVAVEEGQNVTPINLETNTAETPIHVEGQPSGVAIVPDEGPTAAFEASTAQAGVATTFDGGSSSELEGKVTSYTWSFGDGGTTTSSSPTTSHVYAKSGSYTVTLTVTDGEGCSTGLLFTGQTAYCNGDLGAQASTEITVPSTGPGTKTKGGTIPGVARAASIATVQHGKVQLRLTCTGQGPCAGSLKLVARVAQKGGANGHTGKHVARNVLVGKDSFSIAQGKSETLLVPVSKNGASALRKAGRHGLEVTVKGAGIQTGRLRLKEARGHSHEHGGGRHGGKAKKKHAKGLALDVWPALSLP